MHRLRSRNRIDYAALNAGKSSRHYSSTSEEEENDLSAEKELLEEDSDYLEVEPEEDDDEFPEEGEIIDEAEEEQSNTDKLIEKYTNEGNIDKLKQILTRKPVGFMQSCMAR